MGKNREHPETGGSETSHICDILQGGDAGDATVQIRDVGAININGESIIRGAYGFLTTGEREKDKEEFKRDLVTGGGREHTEGGGDPGSNEVHLQETCLGGSVGGPPAHI